LHDEETATINGITVTYAKNKDYLHEFKAKIRLSENVEDTDICIQTAIDEMNMEKYRLVAYNKQLLLKGWKNCEIDETGVTTWYTIPSGTQRGGTPSRAELKQLVRGGRLPKFLQLVAEKLKEAEAEYGEVAAIAERMANAIQLTLCSHGYYSHHNCDDKRDLATHTNAIAEREGAEEIGQ
jgi:hypothetical protein